jgi:lipopolysaccharide transport system permease protein
MSTEAAKHSVVIEKRTGWRVINFKELIEYRDLFYFMVLRDVTVVYKQTILGFAWAIINPLVSMVIFTVIFGKLANISSDGIPYALFSFSALVPWTYFSSALTASTNSLIGAAGTFTKVYFPRLIIPLTPVFSKLIDFFIAFCILFVWLLVDGYMPGPKMLLLPFLILLMMITAAGAGMWLSSLAIQYRDIKFAINFMVQLLMYAAPVVWSSTAIDEKLVPYYGTWIKWVFGLYPMVGIIEGFRAALLDRPIPWDYLISGTASALVIFTTGLLYFRRSERVFADVA